MQQYYIDSSALWCPYYFPNDFRMMGGTPAGGMYSGSYIVNDTFVFTNSGTWLPIDTVVYLFVDSNGCSGHAENYIFLNVCEGVNEINSTEPIRLYPNPNAGIFTLETVRSINSDYTIYDLLGKVVQQQSIISDKQLIYLSDAQDGIYTLVVKGAQPLRFVVMRNE